MLKQPMIEKLAAMHLLGMAEALKVQEQDPGTRPTPEECQAAHAQRLR
jgi:hypothetical protein